MWPCTEETNHVYVPVEQAYVCMPRMQIVELWDYIYNPYQAGTCLTQESNLN